MTKTFTTTAKYYEVLSDNESRLKREGPFLEDTLKLAPGLRVVDMACGTGIHAVFFAELGASVDAFDISSEMIDHACEHHAHPAISYHTGDMRTLEGGPWDLAICLGNSLSVMSAPEDINRTFRAVYSSLSPGGIFLLQILNYLAASVQKPRHRIESKKAGESEVIAVKNLVPRGDRTFLSLAFYRVSGDDYESLAETAVLKNWTCEEIVSAAEDAGFTVDEVYGGYDRSAHSPEDSTDVICVNRKG